MSGKEKFIFFSVIFTTITIIAGVGILLSLHEKDCCIDAYNHGAQSYTKGLPPDVNPYRTGANTSRSIEWLNGWADEKEGKNKNKIGK